MSSPSQMIQQLQQHSVASHNGLNDSQVTLASSCHPTHTAGSLTSQHQHLTGFSSELLACWLFGAVGFLVGCAWVFLLVEVKAHNLAKRERNSEKICATWIIVLLSFPRMCGLANPHQVTYWVWGIHCLAAFFVMDRAKQKRYKFHTF